METKHHAIFLFYNKALGVQSRLAFSDDKKHCDVMVSEGQNWICFQHTGKGIEHRLVKNKDSGKLLRHVKNIPELTHYIVVAVREPPSKKWKPFITNSCNEICRKISLVDVGWTFNPAHLFRKLNQLDGERNFRILCRWSR